jgi:hypothetical protein
MVKEADRIHAGQLLRLLETRHSQDVFIPECKDGPTQMGSHRRLDAWVMRRSWTRPLVIGYEIKVSRGDFLQDSKWPAYLGMCNELWFVCPSGMIAPTELPAEVGLLWASKTGTRLFAKKKAPLRQVEIPESLWRYILMCRTRVTIETADGQGGREYWARWLEDRNIDREFGRRVSVAIRGRVAAEIEAVAAENAKLRRKMSEYDDIRRTLVGLGIDPDGHRVGSWDVRQRIQAQRDLVDPRLMAEAKRVSEQLGIMLENLEQAMKKGL